MSTGFPPRYAGCHRSTRSSSPSPAHNGHTKQSGESIQPTIAAYEAGRKSPTLRTLSRLAEVVGLEATIGFHRPMTREERRSLHLHRAIARRLERFPELVLARARNTLTLMRENHPEAKNLFLEWEVILNCPVSEMGPALTDPSPWSRELRQVTPFAGVLTAEERAGVDRSFRKEESR